VSQGQSKRRVAAGNPALTNKCPCAKEHQLLPRLTGFLGAHDPCPILSIYFKVGFWKNTLIFFMNISILFNSIY